MSYVKLIREKKGVITTPIKPGFSFVFNVGSPLPSRKPVSHNINHRFAKVKKYFHCWSNLMLLSRMLKW